MRSVVFVTPLTLLFLAVFACRAAEAPPPTPDLSSLPAWAQLKVPPVRRALVIGINNYENVASLSTPKSDALLMAASLKKINTDFHVTPVSEEDSTRLGLLNSIRAFAESINSGDVAIIYYSGHGIERNNQNYLIPKDGAIANPGDEDLSYVSVDWIVNQVEASGAGFTVVILDACRTDPFVGNSRIEDQLSLRAEDPSDSSSPSGSATTASTIDEGRQRSVPSVGEGYSSGLTQMTLPRGVIVAFSAEPGKSSYSLFKGEDPANGSIFTRRLAALLSTMNQPINMVLGAVGGQVYTMTERRQKPFVNSFNAGELLLMDNLNLARNEEEFWIRLIHDSPATDQVTTLSLYLSLYPSGPFSTAARIRIKELERGEPESHLPSQRSEGNVVLGGALRMPSIARHGDDLAVVKRDAFVRVSPGPNKAQIVAVARKGEQVRVIEASSIPGWSKVITKGNVSGYIGGVATQDVAASSTRQVNVLGQAAPDVTDLVSTKAWKSAVRTGVATVRLDVGTASAENDVTSMQEAVLRGLRIRAGLLSQGIDPSVVSIAINANEAVEKPARVSIGIGRIQ